MYPNPFDRKHSTIRQVIDRLIRLDSTRKSRKSNIFNTSPLSWRKKTPTIASKAPIGEIGSIPEGRTRSKLNPIRLPLQTPKPKRQETQRGYFMNKPGGMEAHHFVPIEWKLVHASPCYRPVLPSHFINI